MSRSNPAVNQRSLALPAIDVDVVGVASKHLHALVLPGIDKDASAVVITHHLPVRHRQPHRPGSRLAVIGKPLERTAPTGPRKEGELAGADDLQRLVSDLELAVAGTVVPTGAEAEVGPALADVLGDAAVSGTVEDAAVAQVAAAGDDQESAGLLPGLPKEGGFGDGDDRVVWGEVAEGGEGVAD